MIQIWVLLAANVVNEVQNYIVELEHIDGEILLWYYYLEVTLQQLRYK